MTEVNVLETIERFWEARMADDPKGVVSVMAPDAAYEMVGASAFAAVGAVGPAAARLVVDRIVGAFHFHSREPLTAIVDGLSAATVSRVEVSFRGGEPVTTQVCDVWEFDAQGSVTSLKQFVDTALIRGMIEVGSNGL